MGNSDSKPDQAASPNSQSGQQQQQQQHQHRGQHGERREGTASKAHRSSSKRVKRATTGSSLPTELLTSSSSASPSTSTHVAHGTTISASPQRSHTTHAHARTRSSTTSDISAMGQADSKPRPPSRADALPIHPSPSPSRKTTTTTPPPSAQEVSAESSSEAQPVAVPQPQQNGVDNGVHHDYIPTGYAESPYGLPPTDYSRPPRLPLPIEEEVHTPGSPIISPQDVTAIKDDDIEGGAIPRIASVRSATTADDDDVGDHDAFDTSGLNNSQLKVPVKLAWTGPGEKIFVTGTFCNWEKKIKLPRNKDGSPGFSANVYLPPGTHHVKFLVDGEMITSHELPTTVDWTNILVNYIEVVAPLLSDDKQPPEPAKPIDIPGTALTAGQATGSEEAAARPLADQTQPPETEADLPSTLQPTDGSTEQQPAEATASIPIPATPTPRQTEPQPVPEDKSKPAPAPATPKVPRAKYTNSIPEFLIDLDNYSNPEDEKYQRAQRVTNTLPQPPSLPMFLNKSILNGATPHKDDASVLIMPNHTVLNHLATSSIRSGVLATSGTTRYKRKFLTTIMYKPISDDA
ncbi:Putative SNF1 protein kinase subunit beta-2/beta-3 [Septoria linicola]|uniref:SNF1 protein kinase subunit beta-2/beta-3 n=1 Tax=Septoria linicola TaxID=215465 RepID=A0A9Q9EJQ6_9PEZI|nr:Putative SNF1 protein kinase subunit beta-2/beta-3 [Septoria linicola]